MKRVFIQHDEKGDIIATAVVEEMHADLNHPFLLSDPAHGAVELDADGDRAALHETHMVDVKAKKLVPRQQTTSRKPRKPGST